MIVWVPHPVQNRSPGELEQMAEDALEAILRGLTADESRGQRSVDQRHRG